MALDASLYVSGSKSKGKKKKDDKSIGGFISNLAKGGSEALTGLVSAPYYIGKAGYSDAKDALDGGGFSSELAGMGKGMVDSMRQYYGPAFKGEWSKFGNNVYKNPFQIGLDAASVLTLGGAAAGSVGAKVATSASAGSRSAELGARIAGLQKAAGPLTRTQMRTAPRVGANGIAYIQRPVAIKSSTGATLYTHSAGAKRNPVIRVRNEKVRGILDKAPIADVNSGPLTKAASYLGNPDARGARLAKAEMDRKETKIVKRQTLKAASALQGLSKAEKAAAYYIVQGFDDLEARTHLVKEYKRIKDDLPNVGRKKKGRDAIKLQRIIDTLEDPEVAAILDAGPDGRTGLYDNVNTTSDLLIDVSDLVQIARQKRLANSEESAANLLENSKNRAMKPREDMGYTTPLRPGQRVGIISHSYKRDPEARVTKDRTIKGKIQTDMDRESTGSAFRYGLYTPDPKKILDAYAVEMNGARASIDHNYALSVAAAYDRAEHESRLGKDLVLIKREGDNAELARNITEQAMFAEEYLVPLAKKLGDDDMAAKAEMMKEWAEQINSGDGIVIPRAVQQGLVQQTRAAQSVMRKMLEKPTALWRDLTLSLKGSFYVNNWLGNVLLGFVAYGPEYLKEMLVGGHTFKKSKMNKAIIDADPGLPRTGQVATLVEDSAQSQAWRGGMKNPANLINALGEKVAGPLSKITEENFRAAGVAVQLKRDARKISKRTGESVDDLIYGPKGLLNDADYVDALTEEVYGKMLDYSKLTPFERDVIRTYYPFWNFMRSITGRTIQLALDEPWKILVMEQLSGISDRENEKGMFSTVGDDVPHYLKSLAQIGPAGKGGKTPVVSLFAANPFSGAADVLSQGASLASGELNDTTQNPLSSMNPYVKSGVEAIMGRDLFFDAPLEGSKSQIFANQLVKQFPLGSFYQKARYPSDTSIVQRTLPQIAGQYMGISTGTFDPAMLQRSQAINAYYENMQKESAQKRAMRQKANDRGPVLGAASRIRELVA